MSETLVNRYRVMVDRRSAPLWRRRWRWAVEDELFGDWRFLRDGLGWSLANAHAAAVRAIYDHRDAVGLEAELVFALEIAERPVPRFGVPEPLTPARTGPSKPKSAAGPGAGGR